MFFKPQWYKMLPVSVKPMDEKIIERVESFRNKYGLTHETMVVAIMITRWAVKRIQRYILESLRHRLPNSTERELWAMVLLSRFHTKLFCPIKEEPFTKPLSDEEILSQIENIDKIVSTFKSFDDVVDYILKMDEEENRFYDSTGIGSELNDLLETKENFV